jgi:hypothetical protein
VTVTVKKQKTQNTKYTVKNYFGASWWLMPAIVATCEAEIGRMEVPGQYKKGLAEWFKWCSACLTNMRP